MITTILTVVAVLSAAASTYLYRKMRKLAGEVRASKDAAQQARDVAQQAKDSASRSALDALQHSKTAWEHAESARSAFVVAASVSAPARSSVPGKSRAERREEVAASANDPEVKAKHEQIRRDLHANSGLIPPDASAQTDVAAFRAKLNKVTKTEPENTTEQSAAPPTPATPKNASTKEIAKMVLNTPNVNW